MEYEMTREGACMRETGDTDEDRAAWWWAVKFYGNDGYNKCFLWGF